LGEKKLAKSLLISTLGKVIYYIGKFLQGSTNLSLPYKIGRRSAENNSPVFFNMRILDLDFYAYSIVIVSSYRYGSWRAW
jgi:hypothetical protein